MYKKIIKKSIVFMHFFYKKTVQKEPPLNCSQPLTNNSEIRYTPNSDTEIIVSTHSGIHTSLH